MHPNRLFLFFSAGLLLLAAAAWAQWSLPAESTTGGGLFQAAVRDLGQGNVAEAAVRIERLLRDGAAQTVQTEPGRLESVSAWARRRLQADPALLVAYRARMDDSAAELRRVAGDPDADLVALCRVMLRCPLSGVEPELLAAAMARAAEEGDLSAATVFARRATAAGRFANDDQRALAEALLRPITPSSAGFFGPLATETNWYGRAGAVDGPRFLPHLAGGTLFLATARQVLAIGDAGQLRWRWPVASTGAAPTDRPAAVYEPAILSDVAGRPRIIIARQAARERDGAVLRAWAAADGRLIWSVDGSSGGDDLRFASSPVVDGGFVYCVITSPHPGGRAVELAALDTMTGRFRWRAELGLLSAPVRRAGRAEALPTLPQPSPPAVAGEYLAVSVSAGGVGGAIAVFDRFTGALVWAVHETGEAGEVAAPRRAARKSAAAHRRGQYYRSTPIVERGIVVAVSADAAAIVGLDLSTGRPRWSEPADDPPNLIAGGEGLVVCAAREVQARDATSGAVRWTYNPRAGARITGPSVVHQGIVYIPVEREIVALALATGRPANGDLPSLKRYTAGAVRQVLDESGILPTFDSIDPEKRKAAEPKAASSRR